MNKFIIFLSVPLSLIAFDFQKKSCIIDNLKAPKWACYQFNNTTVLQAVGVSSHKNLNLKTKKRLAVANARVNLAEIIKSKVNSTVITNTKATNKSYSKDTVSKRKIISNEKIEDFNIKEFWIHPVSNDVYVLILQP